MPDEVGGVITSLSAIPLMRNDNTFSMFVKYQGYTECKQ